MITSEVWSENGCGKLHFLVWNLEPDLKNRAAHSHQEFPRVPLPRGFLLFNYFSDYSCRRLDDISHDVDWRPTFLSFNALLAKITNEMLCLGSLMKYSTKLIPKKSAWYRLLERQGLTLYVLATPCIVEHVSLPPLPHFNKKGNAFLRVSLRLLPVPYTGLKMKVGIEECYLVRRFMRDKTSAWDHTPPPPPPPPPPSPSALLMGETSLLFSKDE